ncbi:hypothetical protein R5M92_06485 [Halomonas sp. Bachu 37]|uniref:hypothetical protein n=1 Tax=Halomonas kashgarensis TaxID=3084920 RepID=UPI0032165A25
MADEGNVDINSVFTQDSKVTIDESDRLKFAKQVLCWLGIVCIGVFVAYGFFSNEPSAIFNF